MALIAIMSTIGVLYNSRVIRGLRGFWGISIVLTPFSSHCIF